PLEGAAADRVVGGPRLPRLRVQGLAQQPADDHGHEDGEEDQRKGHGAGARWRPRRSPPLRATATMPIQARWAPPFDIDANEAPPGPVPVARNGGLQRGLLRGAARPSRMAYPVAAPDRRLVRRHVLRDEVLGIAGH